MNTFRSPAAQSSSPVAGIAFSTMAQAADTIKVGVLHALLGNMAVSETVLKDTVLMAIDKINVKGGLLGKKLEPVAVSSASRLPLSAKEIKQRQMKIVAAVAVFFCSANAALAREEPIRSRLYGNETTVRAHGPADYTHVTQRGQSSFRVESGKTEVVKVQPGDRIDQYRSTLRR